MYFFLVKGIKCINGLFSKVHADGDSSHPFLQQNKENDVLVYRISEDNVKENENNDLSAEPPTNKRIAEVSEKFDLEREDLFKIVRELLAQKDTVRGSSVYLLYYSNEADSDASSETHDSVSNIKLCGLKNNRVKGTAS